VLAKANLVFVGHGWLDVFTEHGSQGLGRLEELGRGNGIAVGLVDGNGSEGLLEGIEVGTSFGDSSGHFDCSEIKRLLLEKEWR